MSEKLKLICTLNRHIVTDEGDFVPAGTPVQVVGWSKDQDEPRVEVRSWVYMYADSYDYDAIEDGRDTGAVNDGLFLSVPPEALVYSDSFKVPLAEPRRKQKQTWAD